MGRKAGGVTGQFDGRAGSLEWAEGTYFDNKCGCHVELALVHGDLQVIGDVQKFPYLKDSS